MSIWDSRFRKSVLRVLDAVLPETSSELSNATEPGRVLSALSWLDEFTDYKMALYIRGEAVKYALNFRLHEIDIEALSNHDLTAHWDRVRHYDNKSEAFEQSLRYVDEAIRGERPFDTIEHARNMIEAGLLGCDRALAYINEEYAKKHDWMTFDPADERNFAMWSPNHPRRKGKV